MAGGLSYDGPMKTELWMRDICFEILDGEPIIGSGDMGPGCYRPTSAELDELEAWIRARRAYIAEHGEPLPEE